MFQIVKSLNQQGIEVNLFSKLNLAIMEKHRKIYLGTEVEKLSIIKWLEEAAGCRIHILVAFKYFSNI